MITGYMSMNAITWYSSAQISLAYTYPRTVINSCMMIHRERKPECTWKFSLIVSKVCITSQECNTPALQRMREIVVLICVADFINGRLLD